MGNHRSNNRENCPASALSPAEFGPVTGEMCGSDKIPSAQQPGVGDSGAGQGLGMRGAWGGCHSWGQRAASVWLTAGDRLKGDNGRIYEHSANVSQLSMTILNLVRGSMRGAVSSGQVGRFNTTVPQHNCKMSLPHTGCCSMGRGSRSCP